MRLIQTICKIVRVALAWSVAALAEDSGLPLKGVVQDQSGAVVPGAKVKLLNKTTQKTKSAESNEYGEFQFNLEPTGDYAVSIKAKGFQDSEVAVKPNSARSSPIRFLLEVEEASAEITVSAQAFSAPSANEPFDSVDLGDGLLRDLPGKSGDPLGIPLLFAQPAVTGGAGPKLIVDGVQTDSFDLPASSIKQVSTNSSPYSAEFNQPGRGRIGISTSKGTVKRYQGNLMFFLRNSALSARNAFATDKPLRQRGIVDADVSGPLTSLLSFSAGFLYDHDSERNVVNVVTPSGGLVQNVPVPERKTTAFTRLYYRSPARAHKVLLSHKFKNKSQRNQGVGGFNLAEMGRNVFDHENELRLSHSMIASPSLLNQFSLKLQQERQDVSSVAPGPRIVVLDAFSASGAQVDERLRQSGATIQNYSTFARGMHTLRFGGSAKLRSLRASDASDFGGTYRFSSLADFTAGRPYVFTLNTGNPVVSFHNHEFSSFLQDDLRLRPNLSLSLGLRHEAQTNVDRIANFAPRFGLAYSPGARRTVLRAGAGIFYDERAVELERRSLLYDGLRIRQAVLRDPGFPAVLDPTGTLPFVRPSIERLDPHARLPYLFQSSLGIDQNLGRGVLSIEALTLRGVHLYRTRNINAPFLDIGVRPNPAYVNINQFESSGRSRGNALTVTFKSQPRRRTELLAQYAWSRTMDDAGEQFRLPADNYDLRREWGRSDFDRRHRFNFAGTHRLPADIRLGCVATWYSGIPYDITTGRDDNRDSVANDRPPGGTRNTGKGPGLSNIDLRLARDFKLAPDNKMEIRFGIDVFNVLNQVSYRRFIGTQTSPFFGRANAAHAARELQLSLRIKF